jgi:hypothetical protein
MTVSVGAAAATAEGFFAGVARTEKAAKNGKPWPPCPNSKF